jgi:hypothetical protein
MLPPLSNGVPLDENWGIVLIFWQFNDLVDNQFKVTTPTLSWWEKVRELIVELKFLKVGVVCGATARTWQLSSEYDNIVSSVRRMLTLEGIPWFDGTNLYSATEKKGWHMVNNADKASGDLINGTIFAKYVAQVVDFLNLYYATKRLTKNVNVIMEPRRLLRWMTACFPPFEYEGIFYLPGEPNDLKRPQRSIWADEEDVERDELEARFAAAIVSVPSEEVKKSTPRGEASAKGSEKEAEKSAPSGLAAEAKAAGKPAPEAKASGPKSAASSH